MRRAVLVLVAVASGLAAAAATVLLLADDDRSPSAAGVDGVFVLDEPGVYQQPLDDVNDDSAGRRLPDVRLTDEAGGEVVLAEHRGTPMIVNFWFSRCAPCRRELRDFATVHDEVGGEVRIVGVDPFDTPDAMRAFADDRGVGYELLRDVGDADDRLLVDELGIVGYPVTLFVDADGEILRQVGELDADELRAAVDELF